jgi:DNA-binding response OmpR family regulator
MNILIADDDPLFRRLTRAALEPTGHDLTEVTDGDAALRELEAEAGPSLALIDWTMPGLTGVEVCRKVRQRGGGNPPHLILVTAHGRKEDIVAGLEAGADDYLTKPFNPAELRARVQVGMRLLELRSALADQVKMLEEALAQVEHLRGLLPICAWCKNVRDGANYWQQVEAYVSMHAQATFTHTICPDCREKVLPAATR